VAVRGAIGGGNTWRKNLVVDSASDRWLYTVVWGRNDGRRKQWEGIGGRGWRVNKLGYTLPCTMEKQRPPLSCVFPRYTAKPHCRNGSGSWCFEGHMAQLFPVFFFLVDNNIDMLWDRKLNLQWWGRCCTQASLKRKMLSHITVSEVVAWSTWEQPLSREIIHPNYCLEYLHAFTGDAKKNFTEHDKTSNVPIFWVEKHN
jgi:hypothetical protein